MRIILLVSLPAMMSGSGRRRGSPTIAGWAASLTALLALSACDTPTVDARALWIDEEHVGGERTVHIYSRGAFETMTLRPSGELLDDERESLVLDLGPGGRGALLMTADPRTLQEAGAETFRVAYLDLDERRALSIDVPLGARSATPTFSARGDAVSWIDPCSRELAIVPTTAGAAGRSVDGVLEPWTTALGEASFTCLRRWETASARDAPVLFAGDASYEGEFGNVVVPTPGGELIAFRYAEGPEDSREVVELGRGTLLGDVVGARPPECDATVGCLGLVDPDGAALSVIGGPDEPCRIQRWSWVAQEGEAGEEEPAPGPTSCVWAGSGDVLAAISQRHYVVLREREVVRVDWTTGEEVGLPLFGGGGWTWHLDRAGRTVVMVSRGGPMLRISSDQVELVNIVQTPCFFGQEPVVSPSGRWAAWSCLDGLGVDPDADGTVPVGSVIRVSVAGLERYDGVPMWALSIDDEGELLLYSRADTALNDLLQPATSPRNLYVLGSDRELSRVSTLEPDPELSRDAGGRLRWMVSEAL